MSHKRAVYFILLTVMIDAIGIGLIMPVMPALLLDLGGSNLFNAAILWWATCRIGLGGARYCWCL